MLNNLFKMNVLIFFFFQKTENIKKRKSDLNDSTDSTDSINKTKKPKGVSKLSSFIFKK